MSAYPQNDLTRALKLAADTAAVALSDQLLEPWIARVRAGQMPDVDGRLGILDGIATVRADYVGGLLILTATTLTGRVLKASAPVRLDTGVIH